MSTYWATMLTIIDAGLQGDAAKVRAYTELLEQNVRGDGDETLANRLQRILAGERGKPISIAENHWCMDTSVRTALKRNGYTVESEGMDWYRTNCPIAFNGTCTLADGTTLRSQGTVLEVEGNA